MKTNILLIAIAVLICGCGVHHRVDNLREGQYAADLSIPQDLSDFAPEASGVGMDTVEMTQTGGPVIMKAVKDENGEMVAADVIRAAMVTARFRNVAERCGKVELSFLITVPEELQDSRWQLQIHPDMSIMNDSLRLEPIIITGSEYRSRQLRGYERYRKFLGSIITDSGQFLSERQLEQFLRRNIPELYKFRTDSAFVSEETFSSAFGVTGKDALEHYTRRAKVAANNRKIAKKDKMYRRYVKAPIVSDGIRLDTVITSPCGDFVYGYVQTISTLPKLRKVDISLSGEIMEAGEPVYSIPRSPPLTFYISSLSTFADTAGLAASDPAYREGVEAITDRDYRRAISLLRPYRDFNLAVAYCALDYNANAMDILRSLPQNDKVHYMLAILYGRKGQDKEACRHYQEACRLNPSFVHRGNLDPEIYSLIRKYNLTSNL